MNCPYGKGFSHRDDYNLFRLAIEALKLNDDHIIE